MGFFKLREQGKMLKSLGIDLLSIVEHHVPMDDEIEGAQAVKKVSLTSYYRIWCSSEAQILHIRWHRMVLQENTRCRILGSTSFA